jgi:uncharacterized protein YjbI with pentapeptide repeats
MTKRNSVLLMGMISVLLIVSLSVSPAFAVSSSGATMNSAPHTKVCFGKPSKSSDWSNCDMQYMNLANLDLSGINLSECQSIAC